MKPTLIAITGPTASGKSALAVEVASRLGTEIISADSRQIYRGIPIATAAPTAEELETVPHHFVGTLPLDASYSAGAFERDALETAHKILAKNGTAVLCGGSMLYVDAFCDGIDDLPDVSQEIRNGLKRQLDMYGPDWLLAELDTLDPEYGEMVDRANTQRVFHAVELMRASGQSYTALRKGLKARRDFDIVRICLETPRELLFRRIADRVDMMLLEGLEEEARSVWHMKHLNSLNTVGLKEMFAYLEGEWSLDQALEKIKRNTRVYAKKQMIWWRRRPEWEKASSAEAALSYIDALLKI